MQSSDRLAVTATDSGNREDAVDQGIVVAGDPARVKAIEAECPRVLVDARGAGLLLHRSVEPPRHARPAQPALERCTRVDVDAEAARERGDVEEIQDFADLETAARKLEHLRERAEQR